MQSYYMQQGDLRKVAFVQSANVITHAGGGARGKIVGFSPASRRRLLHLFARLDTRSVRCVFLTLTFQQMVLASEGKVAFRRFRERLRRRFPKTAFVWRMERQERGDIHFHLVLFNFPYVPQKTLQAWWMACTRETLSIVHVKLLRGRRRVFYYVSKYCAKSSGESTTSLDNNAYLHDKRTPEEIALLNECLDIEAAMPPDQGDGRIWGVFQSWALPWAKFSAWAITDLDHALYLRWRGLQTAKVTYCPSKFSNIQFLEFGGAGRLLVPPDQGDLLEHLVAQRLAFKYNWY